MRYESGIRPHLRSPARIGANSFYATQRAVSVPGTIGRAYVPSGRPAAAQSPVWQVLETALSLVLPVLLLLALSTIAFMYGTASAAGFGPGTSLTAGHLLLPLTFFAIGLTSRRYGAGMALAQTILAALAAAALVLLDGSDLAIFAGRNLPSLHTILCFGGGLFAGQLFSVAVFDLTRGPRWWVAPLLSWAAGGSMFVLIAIPATVPGAGWSGDLGLYAGYMVAAAGVLLIPYWSLRGVVPPLSGFGGY